MSRGAMPRPGMLSNRLFFETVFAYLEKAAVFPQTTVASGKKPIFFKAIFEKPTFPSAIIGWWKKSFFSIRCYRLEKNRLLILAIQKTIFKKTD